VDPLLKEVNGELMGMVHSLSLLQTKQAYLTNTSTELRGSSNSNVGLA
jgi:hypothetical protein